MPRAALGPRHPTALRTKPPHRLRRQRRRNLSGGSPPLSRSPTGPGRRNIDLRSAFERPKAAWRMIGHLGEAVKGPRAVAATTARRIAVRPDRRPGAGPAPPRRGRVLDKGGTSRAGSRARDARRLPCTAVRPPRAALKQVQPDPVDETSTCALHLSAPRQTGRMIECPRDVVKGPPGNRGASGLRLLVDAIEELVAAQE